MSVSAATAAAAGRTAYWRPNRQRRAAAGAVPALMLLLLFFMAPVLWLLLRSVLEPHPGLGNYVTFLGSRTYLRVFVNTFVVAGVVTAVTLVLAVPFAWFLAVAPPRWSQLCFGIIVLSMWTDLLARTYAWMVLLQQTGMINRALMWLGLIHKPLPLMYNLTGVTIGMTYIMLPFMVLPLHATIRTFDPAVFRAAALCGASRLQCFRFIFLPLAYPGIATGGLMVFVMSLGYFITPALLGGTSNTMLAELIAQLVQSLLRWGLAGAAAFILLVVTLGLYAIQMRYFGIGATTEATR